MRNKILLLAVAIDLTLGDPSNRWHPVAWMGNLIYRLRQHAPQRGKLLYGAGIAWGGAVLVWWLGVQVSKIIDSLPQAVQPLAKALILKTTFSLRGLHNAAVEVETALATDDLPEARRLLSWHLVSRDTSTLDEAQISAAAIQSVAENTSDGIIAPLFWYGVGGLPTALAYRYLQTCDSILGYRDAEREWLGKIPARTDDLLNLLPARLTALSLILLRPRAYHIWRRDARLTASPNAGHPMSAMAGALAIELEKVDHYCLNIGAKNPQKRDIQQARRLMLGGVGVFLLGLMTVLYAQD